MVKLEVFGLSGLVHPSSCGAAGWWPNRSPMQLFPVLSIRTNFRIRPVLATVRPWSYWTSSSSNDRFQSER